VSQSGDLGEQALSKLAEVGISSQLDQVESIDVDIKTDPLKLIQGELEAVEIAGTGMVMQQDLRVESMELQTEAIAIDPMRAMFGTIEVIRPTEATAQVVLTESDINRAFNSDFVRQKLEALNLTIDGQTTAIEPLQIQFRLPGEGEVVMEAEVRLLASNDVRPIAFTAIPQLSSDGQQIVLDHVQPRQGDGHSPELTEALLAQARDVLDLRNFELDGIDLTLQQLNVEVGRLMLCGTASIQHFSSNQ
jgi:hypothetical protein